LKIRFFYDDINFRIKRSKQIKNLIERVIRKRKKIPGDLNFIITGDIKIRELNFKYLKHDYFTDVIAFNYSEGKIIKGEVYISIDTVKRNSIDYKVSLNQEILKVLIHGTLHLCGLNDKTKDEKILMSKIEDKWIVEFMKR
jgi:probable rRNA maturation factor